MRIKFLYDNGYCKNQINSKHSVHWVWLQYAVLNNLRVKISNFPISNDRPGVEQIIMLFLNYPNSHDKAITSMARGSSLWFIRKTPSVGGSRTNEAKTIPNWARASRAGGEPNILGKVWKTYFDIHIMHVCKYIKIQKIKKSFFIYFHVSCFVALCLYVSKIQIEVLPPLRYPPFLSDPPVQLH